MTNISESPVRGTGARPTGQRTWPRTDKAKRHAVARITTGPDEVPALLARGERAVGEDGDLRTGRLHFDVAYRRAEQADDPTGMARAALGLAGLWVHEHRTGALAALVNARATQALSRLDPATPLAMRLRTRLTGEADYRAGTHGDVLAALEDTRRSTDPRARAEALSIAHHCVLGPDHDVLRQTLAAELIAESFRTERRSDLLMGLLWQTIDLFLAGDAHAERRLTELRTRLGARDHLAVGFVVHAIDVMLALRAGRLDEAEKLADENADRGRAAGDADADGWRLGQLVAIRWYQGRLVELRPVLEEHARSTTLSATDHSAVAALAVAAATAGDRRTAAHALAVLRGTGLADLPRSSTWLVTMNGVIEAAHLLGDADTTQQAYDLLLPYAGRPMAASLAITCFGSVEQALGVASLTTGDLDRAVTHLSTAVQRNLALAHWPAVVATRLRLAQALTRRGRRADAAAARLEFAAATRDGETVEGPMAPNPIIATALTCAREGQHWRLTLGHRRTSVEHSVGLLHLAVLIANPGQEIPAIDLAGGVAALGAPSARVTASHQPQLDQVAIREYRRRLEELQTEIDDLGPIGERRHGDRLRIERDWLLAELGRATGIGGRTRRIADDPERARIAVGKAIRRAVQRIVDTEPMIGEHLTNTMHTGIRCSYRPLTPG